MTPKPIVYTPTKESGEFSNVVCTKCGKPVRMVYDYDKPETTHARVLQPDGGLHLTNHYGYGMWRDQPIEDSADREIVLCAPCTDQFLIDNHWLERYLKQ